MLHSMEVEFLGGVGGGMKSNNRVKPNSVEVVLRLSWGCDNYSQLSLAKQHKLQLIQ